jgi:hypothetical protein
MIMLSNGVLPMKKDTQADGNVKVVTNPSNPISQDTIAKHAPLIFVKHVLNILILLPLGLDQEFSSGERATQLYNQEAWYVHVMICCNFVCLGTDVSSIEW